MKHQAILNLYPQVVNIINETAYEVEGNEVVYDLEAVAAKAIELEAEAQAAVEAQAAAKQSALNKLMALGLTEEEALALGVK